MRTSATNRKLRTLLTGIANGTLLPRPEFQRRLVWTNKDKLSFVQTVLEGYPFPEIYIAAGSVNPETGEGTEMLVDGQQRVTTLNQYFRGSPELRLDKATPAYASLPSDKKLEFLEYEVVVRDLGKLELESIVKVFSRINATNYSLNAMEIHNARFDGAFKKTAEALSDHEFFDRHRIFSAAEIKRMQNVRFCLTLLVTTLSTYFNRDELLEDYLEKYNDEFDHDEQSQSDFIRVFKFIDDCTIPSDSRIWKKADLFTAIIEIHRALCKKHLPIKPTMVAPALYQFYRSVDASNPEADPKTPIGKYYKAALQATNDRSNRVARGEAIQGVLEASLQEQGNLLT
jgi:uncharacterized protein DUF262